MKITLNIPQDFEAKYLQVSAHVRYWEDAEVDGQNDTEEGCNIPCKKDDCWCPIINIDNGVIENWEKGKTANIHYKVCDECSYEIIDDKGVSILSQVNEYVPDILCPKERGYGDYIIMDILEDGTIQDWNKHELFDIINNE